MIVKILDVDANRWVWIDQVARCTAHKAFLRCYPDDKEFVGLFSSEDRTQGDVLRVDDSYIPHDVVDEVRSGKVDTAIVSVMYLTMRGTNEVRVFSYHSQVYLMNDEGKTIERL